MNIHLTNRLFALLFTVQIIIFHNVYSNNIITATSNESNDPSAILFKKAKKHYSSGHYDSTLIYTQKAIDLNPTNKTYIDFLLECYNNNGVYKSAIDFIENRYEDFEDDKNIMTQYCFFLLKNKDLIKCRKELERLLTQFPNDENILLQGIQFYSKTKENVVLEKLYKKLILASPKNIEYKHMLSSFYLKSNRTKGLKEVNTDILKLDPSDAKALEVLGAVYIKTKEYARFFELSSRIIQNKQIKLNSKMSFATNALSNFSSMDSSYYQKFIHYALELDQASPNQFKIKSLIGDLYFSTNNYTQALPYYKKALMIDSSYYEIWHHIILSYRELKMKKEVYDYSVKASQYFPTQPVPYCMIAQHYEQHGQLDSALLYFKKSTLFAQDNNTWLDFIYSYMGYIYFAKEDYTEAIKYFEETLRLFPNNSYNLNNYAYCIMETKGDLQKARQFSEKSVALDSTNPFSIETLSRIYFMLGDYSKAKLEMEKCIFYGEKIMDNPTLQIVYERYGDILFKSNDIAAAMNYWGKAKKLGSTSKSLEFKLANKRME